METLTHVVRIYSQDIKMEFSREKCAMLVMKSGKRYMTEGMELPIHDKIRTLGENETYKKMGILEADTIKQVQMKDNIRNGYLRRSIKLLETKLSSRNLIKGVNNWSVSPVRYSGPSSSGPEMNLNKWTKEQENWWPFIRHYTQETTLTDYMYLEKREEEDLPASKTALTHRYKGSKTT